MKIKALQLAERAFGWLGKAFTSLSERCAVCSDCGANRYTGQPCIVLRGLHDCK